MAFPTNKQNQSIWVRSAQTQHASAIFLSTMPLKKTTTKRTRRSASASTRRFPSGERLFDRQKTRIRYSLTDSYYTDCRHTPIDVHLSNTSGLPPRWPRTCVHPPNTMPFLTDTTVSTTRFFITIYAKSTPVCMPACIRQSV